MPPIVTSSLRIAGITAAALVLGGLTPLGQGALPPEFSSLANSVSGWMIPTALLVWLLARSYVEAAFGGALGFVGLTVGYAVVSGWRGVDFDPTFWIIVGVVAGPFIGAAAHALRRSALSAALGNGLLSGLLVGEAVYGFTVVGATTSPVYWWISAASGVLLLGGMAFRIRRPRLILLATALTATIAAAFLVAYQLLGAVSR
ncbi:MULTISPECIES: DUF6518 family protein [unclassified Leifsonia]|uniref:DUF6518 family protein n=1 Tax=unclassified Leifsonia TaxID=2663824 RepID=UPI00070224DD|nr:MULTISPECIES: DUF6518 family protein [unclassified Leifsonia]KQX05590.1 hypothetical protein ASC59_15990 [Leifsonia sp. Root1293]KRA09224.1 hypothetical protein ASD61_15985 [Leifsonia sp. Root60]